MLRTDSEVHELIGHYGDPIKELLSDPSITEICVDHYDYVYFERDGLLIDAPEVKWPNENSLVQYIKQIANSVDQKVDKNNPLLDARLKNKTRISATLPPVAVNGAIMSIRPFPTTHRSLDDLLAGGSITSEISKLVRAALNNRLNFIVTGGTGTGKTSFLRAMTFELDPQERLGLVEDTTENIAPRHRRKFELEAPRRARLKADDQVIDLPSLIVEALRKRPDRLGVGEFRTPGACAAFMDAMNTGHGGCFGTVHATSARDAIARMETLYARQAMNVPREAISELVRHNLEFVIHLSRDVERDRDGTTRVVRRVKEIVWIDTDGTERVLVTHKIKKGYDFDTSFIDAFYNALDTRH